MIIHICIIYICIIIYICYFLQKLEKNGEAENPVPSGTLGEVSGAVIMRARAARKRQEWLGWQRRQGRQRRLNNEGERSLKRQHMEPRWPHLYKKLFLRKNCLNT